MRAFDVAVRAIGVNQLHDELARHLPRYRQRSPAVRPHVEVAVMQSADSPVIARNMLNVEALKLQRGIACDASQARGVRHVEAGRRKVNAEVARRRGR